MKLFEDEFPVDESPIDNTEITTMLLYFSEEQHKAFKKDIKVAMRKMYGEEAPQKGNVTDFLIDLIKQFNDYNSQEISN